MKRVAPEGVPLWRDGTASLTQSLYRRGVWAALALLFSIGSVSVAVFSGSDLTLAHIVVPAVLCVIGALFAVWQVGLVVLAARRSRHPVIFGLSAVAALETVGLIGLILNDRACRRSSELWAIRAGDTALGELKVDVSADGRRLVIAGAYGMHSEEAVRKALDQHRSVREVVLEGPGGRAAVGFALFKLFRERKLATRVDTACASACTIAFLGGIERTVSPSGRLGFHRASFPGMGDDDMHDANRGMRNFMIYSGTASHRRSRSV
jgi:hypothetical protein